MATDDELASITTGLTAGDWAQALAAVNAAARWLARARPGDARVDGVVSELVRLSTHAKWEIRRAVANAAGQVLHPAFEPALAKLGLDDNSRVRDAAERAALRRRDWQN